MGRPGRGCVQRGLRRTNSTSAKPPTAQLQNLSQKRGLRRASRSIPALTGSANQAELDAVLKLAKTGKPVVVVVEMDRPTILTEFIDEVKGVVATFGVEEESLFRVLYGKAAVTGKLPFDLPSDMPSVAAQAADAAHDLEDPLFRFGFGLRYAGR